MKYSLENERAILALTTNENLRDGDLIQLEFVNNDNLVIELIIKLALRRKSKSVKLILTGVKEFSFFYQSNYNFYTIELFKLFKTENIFYLCFDPFNEESEISKEDNDYIMFTSFEALFNSTE